MLGDPHDAIGDAGIGILLVTTLLGLAMTYIGPAAENETLLKTILIIPGMIGLGLVVGMIMGRGFMFLHTWKAARREAKA